MGDEPGVINAEARSESQDNDEVHVIDQKCWRSVQKEAC